MPYSATVLQQRQLAAGSAFSLSTTGGGFLYGANPPVPTAYSVLSTTDSNHTTSVYVSGSGVAYLLLDEPPHPLPQSEPAAGGLCGRTSNGHADAGQ